MEFQRSEQCLDSVPQLTRWRSCQKRLALDAGEAVEFIQFNVLCDDVSDHFPVSEFGL